MFTAEPTERTEVSQRAPQQGEILVDSELPGGVYLALCDTSVLSVCSVVKGF